MRTIFFRSLPPSPLGTPRQDTTATADLSWLPYRGRGRQRHALDGLCGGTLRGFGPRPAALPLTLTLTLTRIGLLGPPGSQWGERNQRMCLCRVGRRFHPVFCLAGDSREQWT